MSPKAQEMVAVLFYGAVVACPLLPSTPSAKRSILVTCITVGSRAFAGQRPAKIVTCGKPRENSFPCSPIRRPQRAAHLDMMRVFCIELPAQQGWRLVQGLKSALEHPALKLDNLA